MPTPAGPGTNRFHCSACGRYFNTEGELREHQVSCVEAKQSGRVHKAGGSAEGAGRDEDEDRDWVSTP